MAKARPLELVLPRLKTCCVHCELCGGLRDCVVYPRRWGEGAGWLCLPCLDVLREFFIAEFGG